MDNWTIIFSAISAGLVVIQIFLVFRINRAKQNLENYVGISEKSELDVKPAVQTGTNEIIQLTNKGLIPIDVIKAKIDILVERRDQPDLPASFGWERKTLLSQKEVAVIPLYEKLSDFLKKHKLIELSEGIEIPSEDPETLEAVMDTLYTGVLVKPFSLMLSIEIESLTQGQKKFVRKKFRLGYSWRFEPISQWEDNYEITINEHMGEWTE